MKKIIKLWLILSICMLGILGCRKNESKMEEEYLWNSTELPKHIEETISEQIHIDADVTVFSGFERGKSDVLAVSTEKVDKDKVYKLLSEGRQLEDKRVQEYVDSTVEYYDFVNGDKLAIGEDWFNFSSALSEYMWYCYRFQEGQIGNNEEIFKKNETDFTYMSMQEAEETCYEILEKVGIVAHEDSLKAYRLEHNMLKEQEDVIVMEQLPEETQPKPKTVWTEDDDSYMFEFYPTVNGFGLIPNAFALESERIIGTQTYTIIYNKNGIVKMSNVQNTMNVEEVIEENVSLLNIEGALKRVRERYEQVLTQNEISIYEIQLGYVVEQQGNGKANHLVPVWCFRIKETSMTNGAPYDTYNCLLIDAVTGEEIY